MANDRGHRHGGGQVLRRHAIGLLRVLSLLALAGAAAPGVLAMDGALAMDRFAYSEVHMGVSFKLLLYAADEATANQGGEAAFALIGGSIR